MRSGGHAKSPRLGRVPSLRGGEYASSYRSRPDWTTYQSMLDFTETVRRDQRAPGPRDMIDLQSFIWVQGSDEYA